MVLRVPWGPVIVPPSGLTASGNMPVVNGECSPHWGGCDLWHQLLRSRQRSWRTLR